MTSSTLSRPTTFLAPLSIREAAFVLDLNERQVNQAIDRSKLRVFRTGRLAAQKKARTILLPDLFSYAVEERTAELVSFTKAGRTTLHQAMKASAMQDVFRAVDANIAALSEYPANASVLTSTMQDATDQLNTVIAALEITIGPIRVALGEVIAPLLSGVTQVAVSRGAVVSDLGIRGGEPVIAGTRIPVYMLADLKAQAVSDDVLLADYPSLTQTLLTQALLYAQLHPRAGRPKQPDASWRKDEPVFRLAAGARRVSETSRKDAARSGTTSTKPALGQR
jgi:uncharacterized protein (DUF433 family)